MLRQIVLRKKVGELRRQLTELLGKDPALQARAAALATREAELTAAVEETTPETTPEDQAVLEAETTEFEAEQATLAADTEAQTEAKKKLEEEIRHLEDELKEIDGRTNTAKSEAPTVEPQKTERKDTRMNTTRTRFFDGMNVETRSELLARDDVKSFLTRVRELKGQNRAVTGADLEIPIIMLDLLRDNLNRYSKLASKVFVKPVSGKSRQTVAGAIPEGIWTEAVGALNELAISYSQIEFDGYKVGGYVAVPNSTLEDSDLSLANDIMDSIGQAIGFGVDKAICFGTGTKMPWGIATRLAQTSAPTGWGTNRKAWTDLHTTNLLKFDPASMSSETFFANLVAYLGVAKQNYSNGNKFWVMNQKTHTTLMSKMITFNLNGALVAALNGTMPIIGGEIVIEEFMADYDILGGYGSLYLLAERSGASLAVSDQVKFIDDQTVFKGTARYDGQPVFGEGFVMVNINNASPTTTASFGTDVANTVATPYALPIAGTYTGAQSVNLYDLTPGVDIYYTVDGSAPDATKTKFSGVIAVAASKTVKAIAIKNGVSSSVFSAAYVIS